MTVQRILHSISAIDSSLVCDVVARTERFNYARYDREFPQTCMIRMSFSFIRKRQIEYSGIRLSCSI